MSDKPTCPECRVPMEPTPRDIEGDDSIPGGTNIIPAGHVCPDCGYWERDEVQPDMHGRKRMACVED